MRRTLKSGHANHWSCIMFMNEKKPSLTLTSFNIIETDIIIMTAVVHTVRDAITTCGVNNVTLFGGRTQA